MALTRHDLEQTAKAAHIALTDDEAAALTDELNQVIEQLATLHSLDAAGVEPTAHGTAAENVLRPDVVRPSLSHDAALANAPDATSGGFRVPKILDS